MDMNCKLIPFVAIKATARDSAVEFDILSLIRMDSSSVYPKILVADKVHVTAGTSVLVFIRGHVGLPYMDIPTKNINCNIFVKSSLPVSQTEER